MTIEDTDLIKVQNLTDYPVVYHSFTGQRRAFEGQQVMKLPAGELRQLNYTRGGRNLLQNFLAVRNRELAEELMIKDFDNEYSWDAKDVNNLLLNGSTDELEDALEFGPSGIVDSIVNRAVALRINDINKRRIIQEYTGRDINSMIDKVEQVERAMETSDGGMVRRFGEEKKRQRRVKKNTEENSAPKRRVVKQKTEE